MPPFDAETIARHAEAVRRLARRLVWDQDRAEDVAQDALVAALEQRSPLHKGLGPWIKGVTRKLAANTQRKERRLKERHARAGRPEPAPAPDEVIERLHAQRLVGDALMALGEPYRRTLYMRYFEDLPPRTIAAQLGLPVNTVHTHLRRGRARLKEEIEAKSDKRRPWHVALLPLLAPRVPTPIPVPGQIVDAEIVLPAGHTITGLVVDDRGDAVPDLLFNVTLHRRGVTSLDWSEALGEAPRTDASGAFTLENVPPAPGGWPCGCPATKRPRCPSKSRRAT